MRRHNSRQQAGACQGRDPEHRSWEIAKAAALRVRGLRGTAEPLVGCAPQDKSQFLVSPPLRGWSGERGSSSTALALLLGSADDLANFTYRLCERGALTAVKLRQTLDVLGDLRTLVFEILPQRAQHHPGTRTFEYHSKLVERLNKIVRDAQRNVCRSGVVVGQPIPPVPPGIAR